MGSALAFGMFILVVVNGVTGGLVTSIQRNFADLIAGHLYFIQVEKGENGKTVEIIKDDKALLKALTDLKIEYEDVSRRTVIMGTIIFNGEAIGRQMSGVNWKDDPQLAGSLKFIAGNAENMYGTDGVVISNMLAENLGLIPKKTLSYKEKALLKRDMKMRWMAEGKNFDLDKALTAEVDKQEKVLKDLQLVKAPLAIGEAVLVQLKTIYGQQNVGEFRVRGIFETQMDLSAYVDRDVLNTLAGMPPDTYNLFGLYLKDFSNLDIKTAQIHTALKDSYDLVPLSKLAGKSSSSVISDLSKEDFSGTKTIITNLNNELGSIISVLSGVQLGSFALFLVVLSVVMVGLVNTFRIVIYERTKEIGTMRAVGAQRGQIRQLFLLEALFLALAGTIPGAVIGYGVLIFLKTLEFSSFTELSFFLDGGRISYSISAFMLIGSFITVIVFTLIAALMPANRAAKMEPAHALRTQF